MERRVKRGAMHSDFNCNVTIEIFYRPYGYYCYIWQQVIQFQPEPRQILLTTAAVIWILRDNIGILKGLFVDILRA